jgi:hypothetical protein
VNEEEKKLLDAEIVRAAEMANIHKFILTLPYGYDSPVGTKGLMLSGNPFTRPFAHSPIRPHFSFYTLLTLFTSLTLLPTLLTYPSYMIIWLYGISYVYTNNMLCYVMLCSLCRRTSYVVFVFVFVCL